LLVVHMLRMPSIHDAGASFRRISSILSPEERLERYASGAFCFLPRKFSFLALP